MGRVQTQPHLASQAKLTMAEGQATPSIQSQSKGERGHLGWVVDTVRDISWVGPAKIAALEDVAFGMLDWTRRQRVNVLGAQPVEAPELAAAEDATTGEPANHTLANDTQGEGWQLGAALNLARQWPPKPGTPLFKVHGPGEGKWVPMRRMVREAPDKATLFYQSWLRPDRERPFSRVSVTAWDPSRLALGVVAGTREPISTTGLKGTGRIPRRADLMPRVVAAFNGGFQTKHGAYGMVEERAVLVPPAGEAATITTNAHGDVLLGTWPGSKPRPNPWTLAPGVPLPPWVMSMRQNLDPLVDKGQVNPAKRRKWGSTAGQHVDKTHTIRTGMCLLEGGALAYFFGTSVSAQTLGKAMLAYHCDYGIHLDMNAGHSGFEFYNIKDAQGEDFKAERMIKKMWHMNFPRYIKRDARDFMYLHLRPSPAQRLQETTALTWTAPALEKPITPQTPARVLQATWSGAGTEVTLLRLPATHTSIQSVLGDPDKSSGPHTVLQVSLASPRDLHWALGTNWPQPPKQACQKEVILLARSTQDVVLAQISCKHSKELSTWLAAQGWTWQASFEVAPQTQPALRFVSAQDKIRWKGGPLRQGAHALRVDVAQAPNGATRLETMFQPAAP